MPVEHETITSRLDCSSLGKRVVFPVAKWTSAMIQIEPVGTTVSTAVLTLKRGLNPGGDFYTWAGGAVTLSAAGIYPTTKIYNVCGFSHIALEVTTAQADLEFVITVHLNDATIQSVAL